MQLDRTATLAGTAKEVGLRRLYTGFLKIFNFFYTLIKVPRHACCVTYPSRPSTFPPMPIWSNSTRTQTVTYPLCGRFGPVSWPVSPLPVWRRRLTLLKLVYRSVFKIFWNIFWPLKNFLTLKKIRKKFKLKISRQKRHQAKNPTSASCQRAGASGPRRALAPCGRVPVFAWSARHRNLPWHSLFMSCYSVSGEF